MLKVDDVVVVKCNPFSKQWNDDSYYIGSIGRVVSVTEYPTAPIRVEHARQYGNDDTIGFVYPKTHLMKIGNLNDD